MKTNSLLCIVIMLFCGTLYSQSTESRITNVENGLSPSVKIDGLSRNWNIYERMKYYKTPGVAIAVIKDFKIDWVKNYGVKDIETGEPVTDKTLFQAASISKTFTATAIMKLAEENKINLNEDVNYYLKSWKLKEYQNDKEKKVTVANLLSHTGGVNLRSLPVYMRSELLPNIYQTLNGTAPAKNPPVEVVNEPGKSFSYSGGGTLILSLALMDILQKPYPEIINEMIFDKLNMRNSSFIQPPDPELEINTAAAHIDGKKVVGKYSVNSEAGVGGLWATVTDLATYLIEHQLSAVNKSNKILSQESELKMINPFISEQYGLGFSFEAEYEGKLFGHSGGNLGFSSVMLAHKTSGDGFIIMINSENFDLIKEIGVAIASEYNWEVLTPKLYRQKNYSQEEMERICGRYFISSDNVVTVKMDNGKLFAEAPMFPMFSPIITLENNELFIESRNSVVKFEMAENKEKDFISFPADNMSFKRMNENNLEPFELIVAGKIDEGIEKYKMIFKSDNASPVVEESRLNKFGYDLIKYNMTDKGVAVLKLNTEIYPSSANTFDSLGEGYYLLGEKEKAAGCFKRALEINPGLESSKIFLKKIEENK